MKDAFTIASSRNIKIGEEITIDYSTLDIESLTQGYYNTAYEKYKDNSNEWKNPVTTDTGTILDLRKNKEISTLVMYEFLKSFMKEGGASYPLLFSLEDIKNGMTKDQFYQIYLKHHEGQGTNVDNPRKYPYSEGKYYIYEGGLLANISSNSLDNQGPLYNSRWYSGDGFDEFGSV